MLMQDLVEGSRSAAGVVTTHPRHHRGHMSTRLFSIKGNSPWVSIMKGQNAGLHLRLIEREVPGKQPAVGSQQGSPGPLGTWDTDQGYKENRKTAAGQTRLSSHRGMASSAQPEHQAGTCHGGARWGQEDPERTQTLQEERSGSLTKGRSCQAGPVVPARLGERLEIASRAPREARGHWPCCR